MSSDEKSEKMVADSRASLLLSYKTIHRALLVRLQAIQLYEENDTTLVSVLKQKIERYEQQISDLEKRIGIVN